MARAKIDYGIDLGTTNSAIARMENGEPVIKKTDTLKDTMPSCINFNKKQSLVAGDGAANAFRSDKQRALKTLKADTNTFIEFKRTMGTDKKYFSSNMHRDYTSEDLSAEVLKKLKSFITDEELKSIVVTVPAKFTINQKDATSRAATLAGFEHCELLQEPIAASMAYGLDTASKDGLWLVFDFGGGTFDAALLKVQDGIMKVIDTAGDNYLGGKNIDYAIVDEILIPHLSNKYSIDSFTKQGDKKEYFREALKVPAEVAKIQLSFTNSWDILSDPDDFPQDDEGVEIELDMKITTEILSPVITPIFQKAIDICKELLKRNSLTGKNIGALILVGGPTYSPTIRKMLKEQLTDKVDTSIDPMTAVAKGAALFASTINVSEKLVEENRDRTKIQLGLGYESTTVEMEQFVTVKILKNKTEGKIPDKVFAVIARSDKAWDSGKVEIDEAGEVIEIKLNQGKANAFNIRIYNEQGDLLPCEPQEFLIIQGTKPPTAVLPYHYGIAVKSRMNSKVVFSKIKGLEKTKSTPATGIKNGLKTTKTINPGNKNDFIRIAIYQGEDNAEGSRPLYNEYVFDAVITGEDLPNKLLPEGSDVDLTFKVDTSERITLSAYFPLLEYSHELKYEGGTQKEIQASWLEAEIAKGKQAILLIKQDGKANDKEELEKLNLQFLELEKLLEQGRSDYDRKKQVLNNLRICLMRLDEIQDETEFPKIEEELKSSFYHLEDTFKKVEGNVEEINDSAVKEAIAQLKEQIPQVIKEKNVKVAKELIEQISAIDFALYDAAMGAQLEIQILKEFKDDFSIHEWSDANKAKMLINQGLTIAATTPTKYWKLKTMISRAPMRLPATSNCFAPKCS